MDTYIPKNSTKNRKENFDDSYCLDSDKSDMSQPDYYHANIQRHLIWYSEVPTIYQKSSKTTDMTGYESAAKL
jgi:hypothetical protein